MSKNIDLTNITILDSQIQFVVEGEHIDLHDDFDCTGIESDPFTRRVFLHFESPTRYFRLVFFNAHVFHLRSLPLDVGSGKGLTFDSLTKIGAMTNEDGDHLELPKTPHYFSIDFIEDVSLVVEAQKAILLESAKEDLDLLRSLQVEVTSIIERIAELKAITADLHDREGMDTKTFLTHRKDIKEELVDLEDQLALKQHQMAQLREMDRSLLASFL